MNARKPPRGTMNLTGGTFIGSAVGQDNTVSHNTIMVGEVPAPASLEDLRAAIAAAREELVGAAGSPEAQAEVRYEVRKIEDELAEEDPEGPVVRSRWEQVGKVLGSVATASGNIAKITDLVTKVFGGS